LCVYYEELKLGSAIAYLNAFIIRAEKQSLQQSSHVFHFFKKMQGSIMSKRNKLCVE